MRNLFFLFAFFSLFVHAYLPAQVRVPFTMDSDIFYGAYVNTYGKYDYAPGPVAVRTEEQQGT